MKVLLVRLSALGGVVHTLPVAENAARAGHEVGWLVEPQCAALLSGNPSVSRVFSANTREWRHRPFSAPAKLLTETNACPPTSQSELHHG